MITSIHLERWADLLVNYAVNVQAGQVVRITAQPEADSLLEAVYRKVIEAGGMPIVQVKPECLTEAFYELANDQQLDWSNPLDKHMTELVDCTININASTNLRQMDKVDPRKSQRVAKAYAKNRELFYQRAAAADDPESNPDLRPLLWTTTIFPTNAYAQDAGMSLRDYSQFVINCCQLNQDDPIAFWKSLDEWQSLLAEQLMQGHELHYKTPAGTDLKVDISGMRWFSSPGRKNFPDGEVYSGPNLDAASGGVEGTVVFDQRTVYHGHAVSGVRIKMENGRATDVHADEGEEFLISMLDQDEGARRIGEVAFGANRAVNRTTGQILFDEKMGGSFHMAFGAGYPETKNVNKSALHWDLIASLGKGSSVTLDGKDFCIDGEFVTMPKELEWKF